jgi:hypothetical protein
MMALTAGCLPRLWMLESVMLFQWLQNTDPKSQPACHHKQGKCDKQEIILIVVFPGMLIITQLLFQQNALVY